MNNQISTQQPPIARTPATGKNAHARSVDEPSQSDSKFSGLMKNLNDTINVNETDSQSKKTSNSANSIVQQKVLPTQEQFVQNAVNLNDKLDEKLNGKLNDKLDGKLDDKLDGKDVIAIIKTAVAPKNNNVTEEKISGKKEATDKSIGIAATAVSTDETQHLTEAPKLPQQEQVTDVAKSSLVLPQSVHVAVKDGLKAVQPIVAQVQTKEVRTSKIIQIIERNQKDPHDQGVEVKNKSVDMLPGSTVPVPARNNLVKDLKPSNKEQSVPNEKVIQLKAETKIETVTVVESTKVKYFPVDVESQAWKQIGQKITQTLTTSQSVKDVDTSLSTPRLDQGDASVSKTVRHLKIQLKPENLGTVDVKLAMTNGVLEVTLLASDKALASRLQQQSEHLAKQLKSAGFSFENLSVQFADLDPLTTTRTFSNQGNEGAGQGSNGQKQSQSGSGSFGQGAGSGSQNNHERNTQYAQREENNPSADGNDRSDGSIRL